MSYASTASPETRTARRAGAGAKTAAALSALLGLTVLFFVGFAQPAALHDAAHDSRHAVAFPCH